MNMETLQNAEAWAAETFGAAELGDARRTDRLVKVGSVLGENPSVSLPRSMRNWADTHAAYQFLGNSAVSHEQIMAPHFAATYQEAAERSQVLLLGDTTDVNLSTHKATTGLGPVGRGNKAQGFFVHSVLAIDAKNKQLLGCMGQEPFVREPAPEKETRAEYNKRWRRVAHLGAEYRADRPRAFGHTMDLCGRSGQRYLPVLAAVPAIGI